MIQIMAFIFLIVLCIQCWVTQIWRFQYPLLLLLIYYVLDCLGSIRNYRRTFKADDPYLETIEIFWNKEGEEIDKSIMIKQRRRALIRNALEDIILSIAWILLFIYSSQVLPIPSYVWIIPLVILLISKHWCQSCPRSPWEITSHVVSIFICISKIIIFSFVLFKIDGLIDWSYSEILWGYWILISILMLITLFSLILYANSIICYFERKITHQGTLGSLWVLILFGGLVSSSLTTVIYVISMFENRSISITSFNIFKYLFLPLFAYNIVLIISTTLLWRSLISFCDYVISNYFYKIEIIIII